MLAWEPQRSSSYPEDWETQLTACGVNYPDWDHEIAPKIEHVILGVSPEKLDAEYPPIIGRLRLLLTEQSWLLPALRIAFSVEEETGNIVYEKVGLAGL